MKGQFRIEQVFAFVVVDKDGTEGVPAITTPEGYVVPLCGFDVARVDALRPLVQHWATQNNMLVQLVVFDRRVEKEILYPEGSRAS